MSDTQILTGRTVLVTGANRGLGRALVDEALRRGARSVVAATRSPFGHPDERVTSVPLDVTDRRQIEQAAARVGELDVLVNNAGLALFDAAVDPEGLERQLAVNLFGPLAVTGAFTPQLVRSGGAVVNVLSLAALAPVPGLAGYSASKAAAFSLTQTLRLHLAGQGVRVHAVLAGPVDTDMVRALDIPKAAPAAVAAAVFDGVAAGEEEIFPDPMSAALAEGWRAGTAKALERENTALAAAMAAAR